MSQVLKISEVFSPAHFYIQLQENEKELDKFLRDLTEFYIRCEERQEPAALDTLRLAPAECRVDQLVAVVWDVDQFWYRARVRAIVSLDRVEIQFIDYGTRAVCSKSQLYRLPEKFVHKPPAAMCAQLCNLKSGLWSQKALNRFQDLVGGGTVIEKKNPTSVIVRGNVIEHHNNEKTIVELFIVRDGGCQENVADILVKEGLANLEHTEKDDKIQEMIPFKASIKEMLEDITFFLKTKSSVRATCSQIEALEKLKSDFKHLEHLFKTTKTENISSLIRFQRKVATDILLMASETSDLMTESQ